MVRSCLLLSLLLVGSSLALKIKSEDEDGVDRLGQARIKPVGAYVASTLIVSAATGLQIVTPGWMQNTFGAACDGGLGAVAMKCVEFLDSQKKTNPLGLVLGHGIVTKACADVLAQTIPQQDSAVVWIDSLRAFRSMLASVLSTSLPFYWWTRFMARSMPTAPGWVTSMLGKGFGTAFFKTVVTQALFRPINVFPFLFLQSAFRGDPARKLVDGIKSKFKNSIIGGIVFYSISNLLMYSVPVPFLHPIMGSVAGTRPATTPAGEPPCRRTMLTAWLLRLPSCQV